MVGQVLLPSEKNHLYPLLEMITIGQHLLLILVELSEPVGDRVVPPVHLHLVPFLLIDVRPNLQGPKYVERESEIHPKLKK